MNSENKILFHALNSDENCPQIRRIPQIWFPCSAECHVTATLQLSDHPPLWVVIENMIINKNSKELSMIWIRSAASLNNCCDYNLYVFVCLSANKFPSRLLKVLTRVRFPLVNTISDFFVTMVKPYRLYILSQKTQSKMLQWI